MPIYEYRRPDGSTFEILQSIHDETLTKDPETGVPVERVFHPVAVHFKGKGFHNTDYGTKRRNRELEKSAKDGAQPDGRLANTFVLVRSPAEAKLTPEQRARRDELEQQLAALRLRKAKLEEDEYLDLLQPLLLELGEIAAGLATRPL